MTANTRKGRKEGRERRTRPTTSHPAIHNTHYPPHLALHHATTHKTEEERDNTRGDRTTRKRQEQREGEDPIRTRGQHTTHHPRHSTGPQDKRQGGRQTHRRGTPTFDGESVTLPPFPHHATHHRNGTPPSTMALPSTTTRGERTEDTPPHEHHRHTLTPQHSTWQGTVRDMTAVLASTAVGRVGQWLHHRTGQDSSSTHHRHSAHRTPRRMGTIHSSPHTVHVHATNDQQ